MQAIIDHTCTFSVLCGVPIAELVSNSIIELDLSRRAFAAENAAVLSHYLEANKELASLDLAHVNLFNNEYGIRAFGKALETNM